METKLHKRSGSKCELCGTTKELKIYKVLPTKNNNDNESLLICETCFEQIENPEKVDTNHWRCLNDSMWSQVPAVQVMAWRMLKRLHTEGWTQDLLDIFYLDENTLAWAIADGDERLNEEYVKHFDSNGTVLNSGDSVVLIKDLNVKGANFTAKRGTTVKGISLVTDNAEQIEGRISGQQIVILTKFVKKSN